MNHPLLKHYRAFRIYLMLWLAVIIIHSITLQNTFQVDNYFAILDALVFNILFAIIGFGLWYAALYNKYSDKSSFQLLATHLAIAVVVILSWYYVSSQIVRLLIKDQEFYTGFFNNTFSWRILNGFFYYLIIMMVYYSIIFYQSLQEKEAAEVKLKALIKEAELKTLKSQINPHFIFNSLNSISSLTMIQPEQAREMIIKLSDYLRYSLSKDKDHQLVSVNEELAHMKQYLSIEKIRFGKKLQLEENIAEDCLQQKVPVFIMQPLLENAIKHGVYESISPVKIIINISCSENVLKININNNFDPDSQRRKGAGMGLKNIENRLKILYGDPGLLKIQQLDNCFNVLLIIPQNI